MNGNNTKGNKMKCVCIYEVPMEDSERLTFENSSLSVGLVVLLGICRLESLDHCIMCTILSCVQCDMTLTGEQKVA